MKAAAGGYSLSRHPCERMSIEVLTVAGDLQGESSGSLLWVAAKVLMFLVPFLLLLRVVTAMREIRLSRRSSDHTADHSFAAILLVSHTPGPPAPNTACLTLCPMEGYPYGQGRQSLQGVHCPRDLMSGHVEQ